MSFAAVTIAILAVLGIGTLAFLRASRSSPVPVPSAAAPILGTVLAIDAAKRLHYNRDAGAKLASK